MCASRRTEWRFDLTQFAGSTTAEQDKERLHALGAHILSCHAEADVSVLTTRPDRRNVFLAEMSFLTADFPASDSLVCIPHFADAWCLHRPTEEYAEFFAELCERHSTFCGTETTLDQLLQVVEVHVKACMKANDLDLPPWRTASCWKKVMIERDASNLVREAVLPAGHESSLAPELNDVTSEGTSCDESFSLGSTSGYSD
eukprot:Rhum_TRINITY_DN15125_c15_g1::Rhum_TRINITY_DN15125_c15_g1_i1::g.138237::m.138237